MSTRLEVQLKCPNPLLLKLVRQWLKDAVARGSKSQYKLREALCALESFPLPLSSGRECAILRGFSATLCNRIDEELAMFQPAALISNGTFQADMARVLHRTKASVAKNVPKKKQLALAAKQSCQITMQPGSFQIILLVDIQETNGKNRQSQTCQFLKSIDIQFEVRSLTLGDFLWIARHVSTGEELVLPYIVERKRMDDLASSIRDGRFHEQKHRLHKMQNVIYLVEDYGTNKHVGLPISTLRQAMTNTQIHSGFTLVHTENHWRSMSYLQNMTSMLIQIFKEKELSSVLLQDQLSATQHLTDNRVDLLEFQHFYQSSARNAQLTVSEVFVQQLLQLHSLSLQKALAIVDAYPTPRLLFDAYDACEIIQEGRQLLARIPYGELQRPIGANISEAMHDFYRMHFL